MGENNLIEIINLIDCAADVIDGQELDRNTNSIDRAAANVGVLDGRKLDRNHKLNRLCGC